MKKDQEDHARVDTMGIPADSPTASTNEFVLSVLRTILRGFDEGVFVRSIHGDTRPGWAIRLLPFLAALAEAQRIVGAVDPYVSSTGKLTTREESFSCWAAPERARDEP